MKLSSGPLSLDLSHVVSPPKRLFDLTCRFLLLSVLTLPGCFSIGKVPPASQLPQVSNEVAPVSLLPDPLPSSQRDFRKPYPKNPREPLNIREPKSREECQKILDDLLKKLEVALCNLSQVEEKIRRMFFTAKPEDVTDAFQNELADALQKRERLLIDCSFLESQIELHDVWLEIHPQTVSTDRPSEKP